MPYRLTQGQIRIGANLANAHFGGGILAKVMKFLAKVMNLSLQVLDIC